jgi:hypothetical protein
MFNMFAIVVFVLLLLLGYYVLLRKTPKRNDSSRLCTDDQATWASVTECSSQCGKGVLIEKQIFPDGCPEQDVTRQVSCNVQDCISGTSGNEIINDECVLSSWRLGDCIGECGFGTRINTRSIIEQGLSTCNGPFTSEPEICALEQQCPEEPECIFSEWEDEDCTRSCGGGTFRKTRSLLNTPSNAVVCGPLQTDIQECNIQECPIDCIGEWGGLSDCSKDCGSGVNIQRFSVSTPAAHDGANCEYSDGFERTTECNPQECPVDCIGGWSDWSECSKDCGGGTKVRRYGISTQMRHNGSSCDFVDGSETIEECNTQECSVDCIGEWGDWSNCSKECDGGVKTQRFSVSTPAINAGIGCTVADGFLRTEDCNTQKCPVDCIGEWGELSECSKECDVGTRSQRYTISTPAANDGVSCTVADGFLRTEECNKQKCPVDCIGEWGEWSDCSKECGGGYQTRLFSVSTPVANDGVDCDFTDGSQGIAMCNSQECPVDCIGAWSEWSDCSRECGGGIKSQRFAISTPALNDGVSCTFIGGSVRTEECNKTECSVDCIGEWSELSECSKECGGGFQSRLFSISTPVVNNGVDCAFADGHQTVTACNVQDCQNVKSETSEFIDIFGSNWRQILVLPGTSPTWFPGSDILTKASMNIFLQQAIIHDG